MFSVSLRSLRCFVVGSVCFVAFVQAPRLNAQMPDPKQMSGAIVRLTVEYPRELDVFIDETALRKYAAEAFEFHLVKKPKVEARLRIQEGQAISSLSPLDLLTQYFDSAKINEPEELRELAKQIIFDNEPDI